jgi:hypothetical protein
MQTGARDTQQPQLVRQDFEFQSWLIKLGMRYLTGGSDIAYILAAGRADVKQLRELKID